MINKKEIRDFYIKIRKSINQTEKIYFDKSIFTQFINSYFFKNFDIFLVYISINNEVGTFDIIQYLLNNGKKVAVPFCHDKIMDFYFVNSIDDLVDGKFGIPTADVNKSLKVESFESVLCIVPAVSFDNKGNRLGYGGGYYDRFLEQNHVTTIGLCYERCMSYNLPTEKTDKKIDYVLTEKHLRNHKN